MLEQTMSPFQNRLKKLMHQYVMYTYQVVQQFPREELYSSRSQLTRAALSIVLNYLEGYARRKKRVQQNFYEMSYGSLVESRYLYYFALQQRWITKVQYDGAIAMAEEIAKMLWSEIEAAEDSIEKGF